MLFTENIFEYNVYCTLHTLTESIAVYVRVSIRKPDLNVKCTRTPKDRQYGMYGIWMHKGVKFKRLYYIDCFILKYIPASTVLCRLNMVALAYRPNSKGPGLPFSEAEL